MREFQSSFLTSLQESLPTVGALFIEWAPRFEIYTDYCNNYSLAAHELSRLEKNPDFCEFAEECRKSRNLIQLKLADFLLVPIQRICKYKLLLSELCKNTQRSHEDYDDCQKALVEIESITQVCNLAMFWYEQPLSLS